MSKSDAGSSTPDILKALGAAAIPATITVVRVVADLGIVPGLGIAVSALELIYSSVEEVHLHKARCCLLANECTETLNIIIDHHKKGADPSKIQTCVDNTIKAIDGISAHVKLWKSYSLFRCWIERKEIADEIEYHHNRLQQAVGLLGVALALDTNGIVVSVQEAVEKEIKLMEQLNEGQKQLADQVARIQDQLQASPKGTPTHSQALEQIKDIRTRPKTGTFSLPPAELRGECSRFSKPIHHGSTFTVYQGLWLEELVAMKLLTSTVLRPEDERRLNRQIDIWRTLENPHVLKLFGYTTIDDPEQIYLVSPWYKNRDAVRYLEAHRSANRFQIINDIALGVNYLHSVGVLHGGLKGTNVLIDDDGRGVISDFALAKMLDSNGVVVITRTGGQMDSIRWQAPELFQPAQTTTKKSDVYAWAMTALEIMSGLKPFASLRAAGPVITAVVMLHEKPKRTDYQLPILTQYSDLWPLFESCWEYDPIARPTMSQVIAKLQAMAH